MAGEGTVYTWKDCGLCAPCPENDVGACRRPVEVLEGSGGAEAYWHDARTLRMRAFSRYRHRTTAVYEAQLVPGHGWTRWKELPQHVRF